MEDIRLVSMGEVLDGDEIREDHHNINIYLKIWNEIT
jgi:hypothetical protein